LFGGFNESPVNKVYSYRCENPKEEGDFNEEAPLTKEDFFISNGVYIDIPEANWTTPGQQERIVLGHNNLHLLNLATKTFTECTVE